MKMTIPTTTNMIKTIIKTHILKNANRLPKHVSYDVSSRPYPKTISVNRIYKRRPRFMTIEQPTNMTITTNAQISTKMMKSNTISTAHPQPVTLVHPGSPPK